MDKHVAKLMVALMELNSANCSPDANLVANTAMRFNEEVSSLAATRIQQHQTAMHDRDTIRMQMLKKMVD